MVVGYKHRRESEPRKDSDRVLEAGHFLDGAPRRIAKSSGGTER